MRKAERESLERTFKGNVLVKRERLAIFRDMEAVLRKVDSWYTGDGHIVCFPYREVANVLGRINKLESRTSN
jgi:hypothetical protein